MYRKSMANPFRIRCAWLLSDWMGTNTNPITRMVITSSAHLIPDPPKYFSDRPYKVIYFDPTLFYYMHLFGSRNTYELLLLSGKV